jgi:hypothetical protein
MTWLLRIVEALNSAHFHGTPVPVEEPSTESEADMATRVCLGERVERRPHIEVTIACLAAAEPIFPKTNNTVKESLDRVPNRPLWDGHLIWMQA